MFDVRSITSNSWWRNPTNSAPTTPLGYPWIPKKKGKPATNVLPDEDSQQVQGAARLPHLIYTRKHAPKISDVRLQTVIVKLLEDVSPFLSCLLFADGLFQPGYSCLDCILHGQFCEFRGFNVNCTTCGSLGRRNCSFTLSDVQLERFRIEAASWMEMGAQRASPTFSFLLSLTSLFPGTWNLCAELHIAFIRAHTSQRLAVLDTQDFHQKFIDFAEHASTVVKSIGTDKFLARFTESNSTESLRERLEAMVLTENTSSAKHALLEDPAHVANFDPDPAAHNGKSFSGPEHHIPTVGEQAVRDRTSLWTPSSPSKRRPKSTKVNESVPEGEPDLELEQDAAGDMDVDAGVPVLGEEDRGGPSGAQGT